MKKEFGYIEYEGVFDDDLGHKVWYVEVNTTGYNRYRKLFIEKNKPTKGHVAADFTANRKDWSKLK